jgi:hypothetical protein
MALPETVFHSCRYDDPGLPSMLLRSNERCSRTDAVARPASACGRDCRAESSSYGHDLCRLSVCQVLNALLRFESKLHPETLVLRVDKAVGVASKPMHVAVRLWNATVAHDIGDLVRGFGKVRPEIPVIVRAPHARSRITFDRVVEVGELERIAYKEDRGVDTGDVPVPFLRIELYRESEDVSLGVRGATLAGDGRKTRKYLRLLTDLRKDLRFAVLADVMGNREGAESSRALGMHTALRNNLAVEVCHLLKEPDVLEQRGPRLPAVAMF